MVCCICSVLPLFISLALAEDEFVICCAVGLLLFVVGIGAFFLVKTESIFSAMNILLEEDGYSKREKECSHKTAPFFSIYWLIATAAFLIYSLITDGWRTSRILWPAAGILFPVYYHIINAIVAKD